MKSINKDVVFFLTKPWRLCALAGAIRQTAPEETTIATEVH
jgi:hypothetical protein